MYCEKCGNQIADDSVFCEYCGSRVVPNDITENANQSSEKTGKKKSKIAIVIAAALIICGAIFYVKFDEISNIYKQVFSNTKNTTPLVVSIVKGEESICSGESYCCWNDISKFYIRVNGDTVTDAAVSSSNPETCEAAFVNGKLVCTTKSEGEATITITTAGIGASFTWVVNQDYIKEEEKGITLLLNDGTVISSGEGAMPLANCAGAYVRYNGTIVSDYKCDVNNEGTDGTGASPWFRCETDSAGKLYLWVLDKGQYILRIQYKEEIASFILNAKASTYILSVRGSDYRSYFYGFGWQKGGTPSKYKVYFDNKEITSYTIKVSDPSLGTIEKLTDGRFTGTVLGNGDNIVTIKYGDYQRSYCWHCSTDNKDHDTLKFADCIEIYKNETTNKSDNAENNTKAQTYQYYGSCGTTVKFQYYANNKVLQISGTGDMKEYSSEESVPWFSYRESIEQIIVDEGISLISSKAFKGCKNVTNVSLPSTLTRIGNEAFRGCEQITSIRIPANVRSITNPGQTFAECSKLKEYIVATDSQYYESDNGILFTKGKGGLCAYPAAKGGSTYTVPNSVGIIFGKAFSYCKNLESITIPTSVNTFNASNVVYNCPNLHTVYYEGSKDQYDVIQKFGGEGSAFPMDVELICQGEQTDSSEYKSVRYTTISYTNEPLLTINSVKAKNQGENIEFIIDFSGPKLTRLVYFPAGLGSGMQDKTDFKGVSVNFNYENTATILIPKSYIFENPVNTKSLVFRFFSGEGQELRTIQIYNDSYK